MEQFGFERTDIKTSTFKKLKGEKKDKVYIVSFAQEDPTKFFTGAQTHYLEQSQKRVYCLSDEKKGIEGVCCSTEHKNSAPNWRMAAVVVLYKLDSNDEIESIDDVLPWIMGAKDYNTLKKIYKRSGHVDIELTCQDPTFNSFTMVPLSGCRWMANEKTRAAVASKVAEQEKNIPKQIATKASAAEIKEYLGIGDASAEDTAGMDLGGISESL